MLILEILFQSETKSLIYVCKIIGKLNVVDQLNQQCSLKKSMQTMIICKLIFMDEKRAKKLK